MRTVLMTTAALVLTAACQPAETPETAAVESQTSAAVPSAASDPVGDYRRTDPSNATLTLSQSGEAWTVVIAAAGLPNGAGTAADCDVRASGTKQGDVITATVTSAGGMEEAEMEGDRGEVRISLGPDGATVNDGSSVEGPGVAGRYCAMGSDIEGVYAREG